MKNNIEKLKLCKFKINNKIVFYLDEFLKEQNGLHSNVVSFFTCLTNNGRLFHYNWDIDKIYFVLNKSCKSKINNPNEEGKSWFKFTNIVVKYEDTQFNLYKIFDYCNISELKTIRCVLEEHNSNHISNQTSPQKQIQTFSKWLIRQIIGVLSALIDKKTAEIYNKERKLTKYSMLIAAIAALAAVAVVFVDIFVKK